ncbi:hypothetical protein [Variovorax guangxiensis]|nr:hypothetical protein [Variovorax guangxiensis]MDR6860998.1 hypothetical protein [Variovorax guangxiensis]
MIADTLLTDRKALVERRIPFLAEVKDMTVLASGVVHGPDSN